MGRRGVSYHARGRQPKTRFKRLGSPCAVLGTNRRWTSFAPLGDPPEAEALARALDAPVVMIWSDDDAGTTLVFATPDGWQAELPIALDADPEPLSAADRELLDRLTTEGIVTREQAAKLAAKLARGPRPTWLLRDGVEMLLGVPVAAPLPLPVSEESLDELGIAATVVQPAERHAPPPASARPTSAARREASATVDEHVLALHVHYWAELFGMGSWRLYHRYKRHLPAERRREVDDLVTLVVTRSDRAEIHGAVARILGSIWTDHDWNAAIRDPEIVDFEPIHDDQLADWRHRLAG